MLKKIKKFLTLFFEKYILYLAIIIDVASMNFFKLPQSQEHKDFIYFFGQSLAVSLYIGAIVVYTKGYYIPNIIASAWLPLAINDTITELFFDNTQFDWGEFVCLGISIIIIVYKINKRP